MADDAADEQKPIDEMAVNGFPTKELFVLMLTRDIRLVRSIIDLIDNSVDGAKRLRPDGNYSHLNIRLEIDGNHFKIADNCGGIPIDIARNYAFRFGRDPNAPKTQGSIGQFGVGMKRAIFKFGNKCHIVSNTQQSYFDIKIDVTEWLRDSKNWNFRFADLDESHSKNEPGTILHVTELLSDVASEFSSPNFIANLKLQIQASHQENISKGLAITLNGVPLHAEPNELLSAQDLKPAFRDFSIDEDSPAPIKVKIYCGVTASEPQKAGWYIYCNGRSVLEKDRSSVTGWDEKGPDNTPKYHNQYSRFRGFVYFDCDDASKLPWDTTKTGVDADSGIYRTTRQVMVEMMRPVIEFLNELDKESELEVQERELSQLLVADAKPLQLSLLPQNPTFVFQVKAATAPKARVTHIRYTRSDDKVNRVMSNLGAKTAKEVGEMTFDYYFTLEVEG